MEDKSIPRMKIICKRDFEEVKDNYKITVSTSQEMIDEAGDMNVLVLQTQFRNGSTWIDNVWAINEDTKPELFMELMFGGPKNIGSGNNG